MLVTITFVQCLSVCAKSRLIVIAKLVGRKCHLVHLAPTEIPTLNKIVEFLIDLVIFLRIPLQKYSRIYGYAKDIYLQM